VSALPLLVEHSTDCHCNGTGWLDHDHDVLCPGPQVPRKVPAGPVAQEAYAEQSDRIAQAYYATKAFPFVDHVREHRGGRTEITCVHCPRSASLPPLRAGSEGGETD
jgi:hypothetical protein